MSDKRPSKIDVDEALAGGASDSSGGGGDDDIEIVEVVAAEPERDTDDVQGEPASEVPVVAESSPLPQEEDQNAALMERLKRLQAEYENYRKRVERDRVGHREQSNARLVLEVLPVLDSFERALKDHSGGAGDEFSTGIQLISRQLREVLYRAGLEPLKAEGEMFDPEIHEAVAATHDAGVPPGKIVEVFEQGYRFRGRLLRPARVRVAAAQTVEGNDGGRQGGTLAH